MAEKKKQGRPKKKKRRFHITKPALQQRRTRVLEMRLAACQAHFSPNQKALRLSRMGQC